MKKSTTTLGLTIGIIAGVIALGIAIYFIFFRKRHNIADSSSMAVGENGGPTNVGFPDAFPVTAGYKPTCSDKNLFVYDKSRVAPQYRKSFDKMIVDTGLYELAMRIRDAECVIDNRTGSNWSGYGDSSFIQLEEKLSIQDRIKLRDVLSKYNTFPQLVTGSTRP